VVEDCREAGIARVWLYGTSGKSNSPQAVEFCRANGIAWFRASAPTCFWTGRPGSTASTARF